MPNRQRGISLILVSVLLLLVVATASLMHAAWSLDLREQARRIEQAQLARRVADSALAYGLEYVRATAGRAGPGQLWMACPSHADEAPCSVDFGALDSTSLQVLAFQRDDGSLEAWLLGDDDGRVDAPPWPRSGRSALPWRVALLRCADGSGDDPRCAREDRHAAGAASILLAEVRAPASETVLARASAAVAPFPLVADGPVLPAMWVDGSLELRGTARVSGAIGEHDPVIVAAGWKDESGASPFMVCPDGTQSGVPSCETCLCPAPDALAGELLKRGGDAGPDAGAALFGLADTTIADFAREFAQVAADCASLSEISTGLIVAASPCFITAPAVGRVESPVVLLVEGDATLGPGVRLHGVLVLHGGAGQRLAARTGARVEGAVMAAGDLQIDGALSLAWRPDLRAELRAAPALTGWGRRTPTHRHVEPPP